MKVPMKPGVDKLLVEMVITAEEHDVTPVMDMDMDTDTVCGPEPG